MSAIRELEQQQRASEQAPHSAFAILKPSLDVSKILDSNFREAFKILNPEQKSALGVVEPKPPIEAPEVVREEIIEDPAKQATIDWGIIKKVQGGETEFFGELYERYVDKVFKHI